MRSPCDLTLPWASGKIAKNMLISIYINVSGRILAISPSPGRTLRSLISQALRQLAKQAEVAQIVTGAGLDIPLAKQPRSLDFHGKLAISDAFMQPAKQAGSTWILKGAAKTSHWLSSQDV